MKNTENHNVLLTYKAGGGGSILLFTTEVKMWLQSIQPDIKRPKHLTRESETYISGAESAVVENAQVPPV